MPDAIRFDPLQECPPGFTRLPLHGLTLLAVEDSRFASDALRLLSQRSGARLRRAQTLQAAEAHLRLYRPDVVLVDMGLPDGRGDDLIRSLTAAQTDRPAVIGISGDPDTRPDALAAGADGFLEKPIAGLAAFQAAILAGLPSGNRRAAGVADTTEVSADPLALHDDLAQAAAVLTAGPGMAERRYLAGFLAGLARQTHDQPLQRALHSLTTPGAGLQELSQVLNDRLATAAPHPFSSGR
ncbi:MAG: response regulator [Paracoccaceae bacterium]